MKENVRYHNQAKAAFSGKLLKMHLSMFKK